MISVELAIGPEEGISYLTDKGSNVSTVQSNGWGNELIYICTVFIKSVSLCVANTPRQLHASEEYSVRGAREEGNAAVRCG